MVQAWNKQKFQTNLQFITLENSQPSVLYLYDATVIVVSKDSAYVYRVVFMDSNNAPIVEASESALEAYYLVSYNCLLLFVYVYF